MQIALASAEPEDCFIDDEEEMYEIALLVLAIGRGVKLKISQKIPKLPWNKRIRIWI